eukprot:399843_1
MSRRKHYNIVVFSDFENDKNDDMKENNEENYEAICQCTFDEYEKHFLNKRYILPKHVLRKKTSLSLNQSTTEKSNTRMKRKRSKTVSNVIESFSDISTITPDENVWNRTLNNIIVACDKMTVKMRYEKIIYFEKK